MVRTTIKRLKYFSSHGSTGLTMTEYISAHQECYYQALFNFSPTKFLNNIQPPYRFFIQFYSNSTYQFMQLGY